MGLVDIVKKGAFIDILRGMSVTGTYFVVDKVTVEYPKEKLQTYPRFRGVQALLTDPETGDTKCVACMLCATICPSHCIKIVGEQTPDGRSHPKSFDLDLSRCIFCGLCEEPCPTECIHLGLEYDFHSTDRRAMEKNLHVLLNWHHFNDLTAAPARRPRGALDRVAARQGSKRGQ